MSVASWSAVRSQSYWVCLVSRWQSIGFTGSIPSVDWVSEKYRSLRIEGSGFFELHECSPMVLSKTTLNPLFVKTYWTCSLFCLAVFNSSAIVEAQDSNAIGEGITARSRLEVCRDVLKQLREGNVEQGLKRLETVADAETPISVAGEDGLATACAGLHRCLSQLSSETQFDLLEKWTFPQDSRQTVRVLTTLVPTFSPPVNSREPWVSGHGARRFPSRR